MFLDETADFVLGQPAVGEAQLDAFPHVVVVRVHLVGGAVPFLNIDVDAAERLVGKAVVERARPRPDVLDLVFVFLE